MTARRTRWSAHLSTLFAELPFAERPAAAARAGFRWVEAWWPRAGEQAAWTDAVRAAGVGLACLNADGGALERGERGFLNVPERREESVAAVRRAVELAASLDGRRVNVLVGRLVAGTPRSRQLATAAETLRECAAIAAGHGVVLVVENINDRDVPGALVPTPRAAVELVEAVGSDAVRVLYDAYHAARMGIDPVRTPPPPAELIGHVQYADAPGRGQPGTGTIDVDRFVDRVTAAGYSGPIGLEFHPRGTSTPDSLSALDGLS